MKSKMIRHTLRFLLFLFGCCLISCGSDTNSQESGKLGSDEVAALNTAENKRPAAPKVRESPDRSSEAVNEAAGDTSTEDKSSKITAQSANAADDPPHCGSSETESSSASEYVNIYDACSLTFFMPIAA